jgi:hypothetical protein
MTIHIQRPLVKNMFILWCGFHNLKQKMASILLNSPGNVDTVRGRKGRVCGRQHINHNWQHDCAVNFERLPKSRNRTTILSQRSQNRNMFLLWSGFRHLKENCCCVLQALVFISVFLMADSAPK